MQSSISLDTGCKIPLPSCHSLAVTPRGCEPPARNQLQPLPPPLSGLTASERSQKGSAHLKLGVEKADHRFSPAADCQRTSFHMGKPRTKAAASSPRAMIHRTIPTLEAERNETPAVAQALSSSTGRYTCRRAANRLLNAKRSPPRLQIVTKALLGLGSALLMTSNFSSSDEIGVYSSQISCCKSHQLKPYKCPSVSSR